MLFTAFTIDAGRELWFVNSGTQQLGALDEVVIGGSSSSPRDIQFLYEAPIYSAVDVNGARTLWRSDIANEQLSSDHILPSNSLLTIFDNNVYFVADHLNSGDSLGDIMVQGLMKYSIIILILMMTQGSGRFLLQAIACTSLPVH